MLEIWNPSTGQRIQKVDDDTPATIAAKYKLARQAQVKWAIKPLEERLEAIRAFRALIVKRAENLAQTLTLEVGKPITQSRREIAAVLTRIDYFLAESPRVLADETVYEDSTMSEIVAREPLGVIANISAWNYPYFVGSNVFVVALIAGNAVLYKPSEFATLTGLHIAQMMSEVGAPFFPIIGAGSAGAALLEQPIDGVFFTGSFATGQKIAEVASRRMIHVQLELGGKDPVYVTDDVDVEKAAESLADGAFYNAGQSCCSVERIYVHERVYDAFVERFVREVNGFALGDPLDDKTYIGPLARRAQVGVLETQVADAKAKGARVLTGGARIAREGNWFAPTVLVDVNHSMSVMRDESFGPVIGIQRVRDDAEASRLMNDSEFALTAGVYSRDESRARALLRNARAGSAYWNCCDRVSPRLPWSGRGHSGLGVTLGRDGLLAFTQPKAYHLRSG